MAERRMFAKTIVLSDAFLDMPLSARCLYFTLGMLADDDGFVNSPKSIMRQCGASDGDLQCLLDNRFIILFETGVIVIKHWRINNYLRNDRYVPTKYKEEFSKLETKENGAYHEVGIPGGIPSSGIPSIGKNSIGKISINIKIADVEPLPLNDGTEWKPTQAQFDEWKRLYPSVDVTAEFRNMRGWCNANPKRRKTARGITSFVNGWLSRTQNNPRTAQAVKKSQTVPAYMENAVETSETASEDDLNEIKEMLKKI